MPRLKYERIAESLRVRIADGEFGPGDLLPSGRDLCEQWSVSRATVIKAMDVLRNAGLVVARQGSGFTVVKAPAGPTERGLGDSSPLRDGGPFRRLGMPNRESPPERVADVLGLAEGEVALRRVRLTLLADGSPRSLVTAWFPESVADHCPKLMRSGAISEGTTRYVARMLARSPAEGRDVTSVRLAHEKEAELLHLSLPAAVVAVLHVVYDSEGGVLVCEDGVTSAHFWEQAETYPMG
ncbi:GntR family transcriptional regulator [Streptomyces niveus]